MASSLRRDNLVCFYCGKRSKFRKSAVKKWECAYCEATNWLDENGEITDPPAFETSNTSPSTYYAHPVTQNIPGTPHQSSGFRFCDACIRNQHLWASALAQYSSDLDLAPSRAVDQALLKFKQQLEERYPQVCEDCEDGATRHLERANKMAKADNLRIRLEQTRSKRGVGKTRTWVEFFAFWGGVIYWLGTAGQLLQCIVGLFKGAISRLSTLCIKQQMAEDSEHLLSPLGSGAAASEILTSICRNHKPLLSWLADVTRETSWITKWTLVLTVLSCWWNPKFRNMIRGFDRHIHGFRNWYSYQLILLVARILFWSVLGVGTFSQDDAPATVGAHCFMLAFTIFIAIISRHSITVDHTRLFTSASQKSPPLLQRKKRTSTFNATSMERALDGLLEDDKMRSHGSVKNMTSSKVPSTSHRNLQAPQYPVKEMPVAISGPAAQMAQMSDTEAILYMTNGQIPDRLRNEEDEMDWTPSQSTVSTFYPQISRRLPPQVSQPEPLPVAEHPFWFKVPPAPVTPAQKLRNPPNQPRLQPPSAERKENFFNDMTRRRPVVVQPGTINNVERHEMTLAQQRFFPEPASDPASGLSELMEKAWTLKSDIPDSDADGTGQSLVHKFSGIASSDKNSRVIIILALGLAFCGWNLAYNKPSLPTPSILMGVMSVCLALSLRAISDHIVGDWLHSKPSFQSVMAVVTASVEGITAGVIMLEVWTGGSSKSECQSRGAILIGVMLLQELWMLLL